MTYDQVRQVLTAAFDPGFKAAFSEVPVEYDNRDQVDREAQAQIGPFVEFHLEFEDTVQIGLGDPVPERTFGKLQLIVNTPIGAGTARTLEILEWSRQHLARQDFSGVITHKASVLKVEGIKGFSGDAIDIYFWYDTYTPA